MASFAKRRVLDVSLLYSAKLFARDLRGDLCSIEGRGLVGRFGDACCDGRGGCWSLYEAGGDMLRVLETFGGW